VLSRFAGAWADPALVRDWTPCPVVACRVPTGRDKFAAMTNAGASPRSSIAELVAATPESRDRYVDFLRAASIVVVMLGHWSMAVVARRNGSWEVGNLLTYVNGAWLLTWIFQVMPVFFFVGGFSNMVTLDAFERRGADFAEFALSRTWRLLKPVLVLLAIWVPVVIPLQATRAVDETILRPATTVVTQPLWFIGIYLIVTAMAPPMRHLHRRFGMAVPFALITAACVVDLLRFGAGVGGIGYFNFAFVWLFAHQLGYFYADGTLARLPSPMLLAGVSGGLAALVLLTRFGPYPLSMVGLPGESISNMNPPTVCLVALTVWQVSMLGLLRRPVSQWLRRPRVWGSVIAANAMIMTMFLWHLTALMLVAIAVLPLGFPQPTVNSTGWWLLRPVWLAILCAVTALFVLLLGRFERPGPSAKSQGGSSPAAAVAVAFVIVGICGFAVSGLVDPIYPNGRRLIALPVSPLINSVALGLGGVFFLISRRRQLLRPRPLAGAS
jgi:hypothetical protein